MKISVAMCTYNGDKYLEEELKSILNQTKKVNEIIICDDGSSDKTIDIIKKYAKNNEIIKYYVNNPNIGVRKNFQLCLAKTTGDIVFLADQDDIWETNKVETIVNYFSNHDKINVIATNASLIDQNGQYLLDDLWKNINYVYKDNNYLTNFNALLIRPIATGATMAMRSSFIKKYDYQYKAVHHDYWYSLMASMNNSLYMLNNKLTRYRLHETNLVGLNKQSNFQKVKNSLFNCHKIYSDRYKTYLQCDEVMQYFKKNKIINDKTKILGKKLYFYEVRLNIKKYSFRNIRKIFKKFKKEGYYKLFTRTSDIKNYYYDLYNYMVSKNYEK